jgi:multiple sugar transport system substrate-binding protein
VKRTLFVLLGLLLKVSLASAVTLTYATWNLGTPEENNLERQMLNAWNAENPDIQVVPATGIETGDKWMPSLAAAAAAGKFPDIVMLTTLPDYIARDWLADITAMAAADPEWMALPGPVRTSTTFNYRIYSIPFAQQMWGFFVNRDLLAANNVKIPDQSWSIADFTNIVKTMTQPRKPTLGMTEEVDIPSWYPIAANSSYGWFTWDGRAYHLDSPEFRAGVELARSFYTNGQVWATLPDAARKTINAAWQGEAFTRGYAALMWDGTWAFADAAKWTFKWDFLPIPGARGRVIGIPDYLGIGKSSRNAGEAYAFAKYMSAFSKRGFLKRIDLVRAGTAGGSGGAGSSRDPAGSGGGTLSPLSLPLTRDPAVLNAYFALMNIPALPKLFANLDNEVLEPLKWVPGYQLSRWDARVTEDRKIGDVVMDAVRGDVKLADVAPQLNRIANQEYQDALAALAK